MVKVQEVEKREALAAICRVSESSAKVNQVPARHAAT
jgi:hypothetical protein